MNSPRRRMTKLQRQEVGASDDTIRLCRATAAVRHAELRLASQATNRTGLETRATSIIGWSVPIALAAVALILIPQIQWITYPALAVVAAFLVAAGLACAALWPRDWNVVGVPAGIVLSATDASELQFQERVAGDYGKAITENQRQLLILSWLIRLAWIAMAVAPLLAAIVGWIFARYSALVWTA